MSASVFEEIPKGYAWTAYPSSGQFALIGRASHVNSTSSFIAVILAEGRIANGYFVDPSL
jgi:hypothetical protein